MKLIAYASLLAFILILGCTPSEMPLPYTIINVDENKVKNDIYYRIVLNISDEKTPTQAEIEAIYRALFDESKRKFVVFMYLPSMNTSSAAYATCSKLPNGDNGCNILGR